MYLYHNLAHKHTHSVVATFWHTSSTFLVISGKTVAGQNSQVAQCHYEDLIKDQLSSYTVMCGYTLHRIIPPFTHLVFYNPFVLVFVLRLYVSLLISEPRVSYIIYPNWERKRSGWGAVDWMANLHIISQFWSARFLDFSSPSLPFGTVWSDEREEESRGTASYRIL